MATNFPGSLTLVLVSSQGKYRTDRKLSPQDERNAHTKRCDDAADDCDAAMTVKSETLEDDLSSEELTSSQDVANLEKYADSDIIYNRQDVARSILNTLRSVVHNQDKVATVISVMCKLLDDEEPTVRGELMEHLPHIAVFCHEHCHYLETVVHQQVVPMIVNCLTDTNNQVRKSSQAALLVVLEQGLIDKGKLEEWICPLVVQLTEIENLEEQRTEATTLMCKMSPMIGKDMTERLFLQRFGSLCLDASFHVRKVCSSNFGEFCTIVGREATEEFLLPKFYYLCEDGVWGVRKCCAEVFMPVSCVCSIEIRKSDLAPLFVNLLCDQSRWVRMAAFQTLGPFISTFANQNRMNHNCSDREGLKSNISLFNEKQECIERTCNSHIVENTIGKTSFELSDSVILCENVTDRNISHSSLEDIGSDYISFDLNEQIILSETDRNISHSSLEDIGSDCIITKVPCPFDEFEQVDSSNNVNNDGCFKQNSCDKLITSPETEADLRLAQEKVERHLNASVLSSQKLNGYSQDVTNSLRDLSINSQSAISQNTISKGVDTNKKGSIPELPLTVTTKDGHLHVRIDNESAFNNFQYWRIPIPDLEVDIDIEDGKATNVHIRACIHDENNKRTCASDLSVSVTANQKETSSKRISSSNDLNSLGETGASKMLIQTACINTVTDGGNGNNHSEQKMQVLSSSLNEAALTLIHGELQGIKRSRMNLYSPHVDSLVQPLERSYICMENLSSDEVYFSPHDQDIVPSDLLQHYLSMSNSPQTQAIDPEITHHCAYSLPAVALTLGKKYWPCLKETYEELASDMQWKVRRTLASSLHELALILGTELAARDLLPVFSSFLRDLDEVRIGILQHLSQFLRWLQPSERRGFLPQLCEFLKLDNDRNWRFRLTLTEQLIPVTNLYSPSDVKEYLIPIAITLVSDKVCEVRRAAVRAIAVMLRRLRQSPNSELVESLLRELEEKFKCGSRWQLRQIYALQCQHIAQECSLPKDQYVSDIVPSLLTLSWDSVPNVRLVVARCLAETLLPLGYFPQIEAIHYELLHQVMYSFQTDVDRDVRHFARRCSEVLNIEQQQLPV